MKNKNYKIIKIKNQQIMKRQMNKNYEQKSTVRKKRKNN